MDKPTSEGPVAKAYGVLQEVPKEVRKALADQLFDLYQKTEVNRPVAKADGVLQEVDKEVRKALAVILLDLYRKAVFNHRVMKAYIVLSDVYNELGGTLPVIWHDKYRDHEAGREELLAELLICSQEEQVAWDALLLIVQFHLEEDMPLPPELKSWLFDVLAKIRTESEFSWRPAWLGFVQELTMVVAVSDLLKEDGLRPTRHRKRRGQSYPKCCYRGGSACDIVGVAAGRLYDLYLSYKRVERLWSASASPKSPLYRKGPSQCPIMEHPLYMLRDKKRVKARKTTSGTSEDPRDLARWLDFMEQRAGPR